LSFNPSAFHILQSSVSEQIAPLPFCPRRPPDGLLPSNKNIENYSLFRNNVVEWRMIKTFATNPVEARLLALGAKSFSRKRESESPRKPAGSQLAPA
jgi:hypothetical protein